MQEADTQKQGLVISYFGNSVAVEAENGQVFQCHLRRNQELPVVGDEVIWQFESADKGSITTIKPRRSVLGRGDAKGKMKPIAANIDAIFIVMSPEPIFSEFIIDRYIIAAELLNIQPVIVLNKIDLLDDATWPQARARLEPYRHIPYAVVLSSIYTEDGLLALASEIKNKSGVLVGPSGVGKSSIIAGLSNQEAIRVAGVTSKGIGKHTTTTTRLYHLPQGGYLIDSPGVREFNLWPVGKEELLKGFKEFGQYVNECKFRDCSHSVEPHCAVQAAVNNGKISAKRYENYQSLMKGNNNRKRK